VTAYPNNTNNQLNLARHLIESAWSAPGTTWKANYEEAAALLESLLAVEPNHLVALVNLGVALSDQGFHARAMEYYRRAESLDLVDGNLQFNLGVALLNLRDQAGSIRCFQKATSQPDRPDTIRAYFDPLAH
jgi:tetratricopeptide (TPR) repeat protein